MKQRGKNRIKSKVIQYEAQTFTAPELDQLKEFEIKTGKLEKKLDLKDKEMKKNCKIKISS